LFLVVSLDVCDCILCGGVKTDWHVYPLVVGDSNLFAARMTVFGQFNLVPVPPSVDA
jgi:hypothetical protein